MSSPLEPYNLEADLVKAEVIKQRMTELLRDLEAHAAGKPIAKPGGWRHHPTEWAAENLPYTPPESPAAATSI